MGHQLKSYNVNPPGNYSYEQTQGIPRRFGAQPVIEGIVKTVSNFRIANKLQRASLAECLEDVDRYTCARLHNNPDYCWDCPQSFEESHKSHLFVKPSCASCGTVANPQ